MFIPFANAVDSSAIPKKTLYTGDEIPCIGFGTFSANHSPQAVSGAVKSAIKLGYRFLDCAASYGNETEIGKIIHDVIVDGLLRKELFILSKLWNTMHTPECVGIACRKTLSDLHTDYLDAYLVHWPVPNALSPHAADGIFNEDSRSYIHEEFMETWQAMEQLVDQGLVRFIGVSNVTIPKLTMLLADAHIHPAINEMELHPTFQQGELFQFCVDHDILPIGYSPIGAPARPERNRMPGDLVDTEDETIVHIADAHGIHPAVVCVKWAIQRGQIPIPFSAKEENILANLLAVTKNSLTDEEMNAIRGSDRNCRLSRGQGYLWQGAPSFLSLWDINGTV